MKTGQKQLQNVAKSEPAKTNNSNAPSCTLILLLLKPRYHNFFLSANEHFDLAENLWNYVIIKLYIYMKLLSAICVIKIKFSNILEVDEA